MLDTQYTSVKRTEKKLSFGYTEVMYAKDIFSLSNFRTPTKNSRT